MIRLILWFLCELRGPMLHCPICDVPVRRFREQRLRSTTYRLCPTGIWFRVGFVSVRHSHQT